MRRVFILLVCMALGMVGCSETSSSGGPTVGGESTTPEPEGGESSSAGESSSVDVCDELDCDDGEECTVDSCNGWQCVYEARVGQDCDDGDVCTLADSCSEEGACVGDGELVCDDGNGCTMDSCDAKVGCVNQSLSDGSSCNDGDSCTLVDTCQSGECQGTAKPCPDDENPCTVPGGCDEKTGECLFVEVPDGTLCSDGNDCTDEDTCVAGACESAFPTECFDNNSCTDDGCNPKGGCTFFPNQEFCDDGSMCTTNDQCQQGQCKGAMLLCDDGNQCTNDGCDPASGCVHDPVDTPCEDGNPCTLNDHCEEALCVSGDQKPCDDNNPCTSEYCNLDSGACEYDYNAKLCDDGDQCTSADTCALGVCAGTIQVDCDDNNGCTTDSCVSEVGCVHDTITNLPCDDGNACTSADTCVEGECAAGDPKDCDDNNGCTTDSCDANTGCFVVNNAESCDDGNACTTGDVCVQGVCTGGELPSATMGMFVRTIRVMKRVDVLMQTTWPCVMTGTRVPREMCVERVPVLERIRLLPIATMEMCAPAMAVWRPLAV